jgi:hypothetical protein
MTETGGRPIVAALEMLIGAQRLFNSLPEETLPALLVASRKAQAEVSTKLSLSMAPRFSSKVAPQNSPV